MNAKSLRSLFNKTGFPLLVQPGYIAVGVRTKEDNSAMEYYQKVTIDQVKKTIEIKGVQGGVAANGVYIPAMENRCTYYNVSLDYDIVVSGRFTGCTFAICHTPTGIAVAHIFVDSKNKDNNPNDQITALEAITNGTVLNTFSTQGTLDEKAGEAEGFVFGTRDAGTWNWHWVTKTSGEPGTVITCRQITKKEWA